jgi:hypothetical protein
MKSSEVEGTRGNSSRTRSAYLVLIVFAVTLYFGRDARGDVTILLGEPINFLGHVTSTGHAALYFDHICSDDHIRVRTCRVGEDGVVISRYKGIGGYDWLAMEPTPYLYSVRYTDDIPSSVTQAEFESLREDYRSRYLGDLAKGPPNGMWIQLLGASYRREIFGIRIKSTPEQDAKVIAFLNGSRNQSHFNFFLNNCADFCRRLLDVTYPGAVRRNLFFDFGMTTPKQLAASLHRYSRPHPEVNFQAFSIRQVPGDIARSGRMYGVSEAFVRTKPYLLPLAVVQPIGIGSVTASFLLDRRYDIQKVADRPDGLIGRNVLSDRTPTESQPKDREASDLSATRPAAQGNSQLPVSANLLSTARYAIHPIPLTGQSEHHLEEQATDDSVGDNR